MNSQIAQQGGEVTDDEFEVILEEGIQPGSEKPAQPAEQRRMIKVIIPRDMEYTLDFASDPGSTCFRFYLEERR